MKPNDATIVAGSTKIRGLICNSHAKVNSNGKISAALTVLPINSITKSKSTIISHKKTTNGTYLYAVITLLTSVVSNSVLSPTNSRVSPPQKEVKHPNE
jgi:hypothetical protein